MCFECSGHHGERDHEVPGEQDVLDPDDSRGPPAGLPLPLPRGGPVQRRHGHEHRPHLDGGLRKHSGKPGQVPGGGKGAASQGDHESHGSLKRRLLGRGVPGHSGV